MRPGAPLGHYTIDRELGSGGMGAVYAATGPDGVVALKVVHPHLLETPGFFKRFMREAQLGQSIRHENVVRTLDCDQEFADGRPQCFLVMEYVEGQTLSELLHELERVPEELCRHVAREICKGLAAVHEAGVVHRDLKPENVLITPDHVVKVMDLGVAQVADEALRLSKSGAFVGSVEYAAPEQFKGGEVDGRTDLHALGVLLYELASGQHPYGGGTFHEVLTRVCENDPRRLGEVNPQLSAFFEEVVHTLLVKDPRGRFASATQLLDVLDAGEDSPWWHERARRLQEDTKRPLRRIRIPRETAVYGRDAELATLRELFDKARSADGQVVLIEGEAGIGKSRLVDELIGRLQAEGEDLVFLFGSYPPGGAATAAGAFSAAYREHLGEAGSARQLTTCPSLVPAFDAVLRGDGVPEGAEPLTKESLQTCFVNVTRALAAEQPTVVLIDDLHFAPDEGRALFTALAMAAPSARVLLVGTTRPGVSEDWKADLTRLDQVRPMPLHRLGPKDLAALLRESFGSEHLAEQLAYKIATKSDGNPFFAFEIIRGLREGQFITQRDDGTWASTRVIEDLAIPSSVLDLVNARVADLSEEERDILDVACCLGFAFDPLLVAEVLGLARIPLLKRLGQIERQHRLVRSSGVEYVFDHHQVQEALYGSLSELLRREYHGALAETLETRAQAAEKEPSELAGALCVDLCGHFLKAARGDRALRYLSAAQEHLKSAHLPAQVAALTERALAVPGLLTGNARAAELTRLADVCALTGRRDRQLSAAEEAHEIAVGGGPSAALVTAKTTLGRALGAVTRIPEAEEILRGALELAVELSDRAREGLAAQSLAVMVRDAGRWDEARELLTRSVACLRDAGDDRGLGNAQFSLAQTLLILGAAEESRSLAEDTLQLSRRIGDRRLEAVATWYMGVHFGYLDRVDDARRAYADALATATEVGDRSFQARARASLGLLFLTAGDLPGALEHFDRALEVAREIGDERHQVTLLGWQSTTLERMGRQEDALRLSEEAVTRSREIGVHHIEAVETSRHGSLLYTQRRLHDALRAHERAIELLKAIGAQSEAAVALVNVAATLRQLGDPAGTRETATEAIALSRETRSRKPEAFGVQHLGQLADDANDPEGALRLFEEALAIRREIDDRHDIVFALLRIADVQHLMGRIDEARAAAAEAAQIATEIGMPRELSLARARLACLPGADEDSLRAALADVDPRIDTYERHWHLYQATGGPSHLATAKRLLEEHITRNPPEFHEAMRTNIRVHREILAASHDLGRAGNAKRRDADAADPASPGESPTRAG